MQRSTRAGTTLIQMNDATPRWKYRFASYKNALILLREAMDKRNEFGLNQLEKEGAIQRF